MQRPCAECYACLSWEGHCAKGCKPSALGNCFGYAPLAEPTGEEAETMPMFGEVPK